jgi:hypothetical protein
MDRRQASIDEENVKLSLRTTVGFAIGVAMVVATGLASYYGGRLALEQNLSDIRERVVKIEAVQPAISDLQSQMNKNTENITAVRQGVWILLHDRGYDADKILSSKTP